MSADGHRPHVVVIGSINMDLVVRVERLPRAGETVQGSQFLQIPGGKGANQAVAANRLGARCSMIGRVGNDSFGRQLKDFLTSTGVGIDHVTVTEDCSSGVALIGVDSNGENSITIVSGANDTLTPDDIRRLEPMIASADAMLLQLEIPLTTVETAITVGRSAGVLTVLDTAPAPRIQLPSALHQSDVISPNQTEAELLTGVAVDSPADAARAAHVLRERGAGMTVIKLGEQGALLVDEQNHSYHVPAAAVDVVDTTAAGDAFTAAMTVGLVERMPAEEAVRFGCAAGTLATMKMGAQQSMPTRTEVEEFLKGLQ